jgi:phage baseplate assembly protein V
MTADLSTDLSELLRLILNMIRVGSVVDIDYDAKLVRVQVGKNTPTWRPWAVHRAGDAQTWWPPSFGEQVILLSPEGNFDNAVILPALYSDQFQPPSNNPAHHTTRYKDGAVIQYDSVAHALTATLPGGTSVSAVPGTVTSNAEDTICTGNLTVEKNLTVNGFAALNAGMNVMAGKAGGPAAMVQGVIQATMDVIAAGISLVKHPHGGVKKGDDDTGGPK